MTAAVHSISKHSVLFGVQNDAGDAGGILRYDLENKIWFFDDVGPVTALAEFGEQIAFVQGGIVYLQDSSPGTGTFVTYQLKSGMFQGNQELGWGAINKVGFLGTFRGDCTVEAFISFDGLNYTSMGQQSISSAEYSVGQRVVRLWTPKKMKSDQFSVKYVITGTTDSEGLWLHSYALDVERSEELSRQGPAHEPSRRAKL